MRRTVSSLKYFSALSLVLALSACTAEKQTSYESVPRANEIQNTENSSENNSPTPTDYSEKNNPAEEISSPPTKTAVPKESNAFVNINVPFTAQAPTGDWDDERQQDGCEEASALMAMRWVQGKKISSGDALKEIIAISDFEQKNYGEYRDISLNDVKAWIFGAYFKHTNVEVRLNASAQDIINELEAGHVVLAPMQGQKLGNPYFSGAGPERHMLLIRGYDPNKNQFITNDPGTKRGEGYRYSVETIMNANLAYPTGHHEVINGNPKGIIVVKK